MLVAGQPHRRQNNVDCMTAQEWLWVRQIQFNGGCGQLTVSIVGLATLSVVAVDRIPSLTVRADVLQVVGAQKDVAGEGELDTGECTAAGR